MAKTLAGRCGAALAVLFVVSLLTFAALHVVPGDTATLVLGTDATPQALQQLRESMGLDRSLPEQYVSWICGVLTGDWGNAAAVFRAHRHFRRMRRAYTEHPSVNLLKVFPHCRHNILADYYLRRRRTFSQL